MFSMPATGTVKGVFFSLGITPSQDPQLNCAQAICDLFKQTEETAYIAIYALTEPSIIAAMIEAHDRGVEVPVVADYRQSKGKAMANAIKQLRDADITVDVTKKQKFCMHNKVGIFDMRYVAAGSYNWTVGGSRKNDENLIVLEGSDIAEKYYRYVFLRVLENETLMRI